MIDEIDQQIEDEGFITTLNLVGTGATAYCNCCISLELWICYIRSITL